MNAYFNPPSYLPGFRGFSKGRPMRCPNPTCQSDKLRIIDTAHAFQDPIPAEYRSLNIVRRRRECPDCKERFWTIELTADDFQTLRRRSRGLETPVATVRPVR